MLYLATAHAKYRPEPLTLENWYALNRVRLMETFGWTPDQVDRLSYDEIAQITAVLNATAEVQRIKSKKPPRR